MFEEPKSIIDAGAFGIITPVRKMINNHQLNTPFSPTGIRWNESHEALIIDRVVVIQNKKFLDNLPVIFNGKFTVLDDLTKEEIYQRIKIFYNKVLDNCLGKSAEEQDKYLFPNRLSVFRFRLMSGVIEASEEYFRGLPDTHEKADLNDLCKQILSGKLEYGYHVKDEYSVEMHFYAATLQKLL